MWRSCRETGQSSHARTGRGGARSRADCRQALRISSSSGSTSLWQPSLDERERQDKLKRGLAPKASLQPDGRLMSRIRQLPLSPPSSETSLDEIVHLLRDRADIVKLLDALASGEREL